MFLSEVLEGEIDAESDSMSPIKAFFSPDIFIDFALISLTLTVIESLNPCFEVAETIDSPQESAVITPYSEIDTTEGSSDDQVKSGNVAFSGVIIA